MSNTALDRYHKALKYRHRKALISCAPHNSQLQGDTLVVSGCIKRAVTCTHAGRIVMQVSRSAYILRGWEQNIAGRTPRWTMYGGCCTMPDGAIMGRGGGCCTGGTRCTLRSLQGRPISMPAGRNSTLEITTCTPGLSENPNRALPLGKSGSSSCWTRPFSVTICLTYTKLINQAIGCRDPKRMCIKSPTLTASCPPS